MYLAIHSSDLQRPLLSYSLNTVSTTPPGSRLGASFSADNVDEEDQTDDMAVVSTLKCVLVFSFPSIRI